MKWQKWPYATSSRWSPPSRGAWIEIDNMEYIGIEWLVAPLAGGVD